jgi:hypothetical protein
MDTDTDTFHFANSLQLEDQAQDIALHLGLGLHAA